MHLLVAAFLVVRAASESGSYLQSRFHTSSSGGSFYPGWAFKQSVPKGLGYPPIPFSEYPTYNMAGDDIIGDRTPPAD